MSDDKVFRVQRTRFCNLWDLPNDHVFDKDFLISIIKSNIGDPIAYNEKDTTITFAMIHLAREILCVEYHTFTK